MEVWRAVAEKICPQGMEVIGDAVAKWQRSDSQSYSQNVSNSLWIKFSVLSVILSN